MLLVFVAACGSGGENGNRGTGGAATGGVIGSGGLSGSGAATGTGGASNTGGVPGTGGMKPGTGGATGSGGRAAGGAGGGASGGAAGGHGGGAAGGPAGGAGGAATGGTAGAAGARGAGGGGGTDSHMTTDCPTAPPSAGQNCPAPMTCYYEDCAGAGRTVATCAFRTEAQPHWLLSTAACGTVRCAGFSSMTCPAGQLCVIHAGGTLSATCAANTCGTSAVTCGCFQSCDSNCTMMGAADGGFTLYCDACPIATCA